MQINDLFSLSGPSTEAEKQHLRDLLSFPVNNHTIRESLLSELSNRRQGTRSTKGRSDVCGTTRKPWSQKGTGRARAGSVKSPLWKGGGVVFGPKPRDYSFKMLSKVKTHAFVSVLAKCFQGGCGRVIDVCDIAEGKTKVILQKFLEQAFLSVFPCDVPDSLTVGRLNKLVRKYRCVIVTGEANLFLQRAVANIPWLQCLNVGNLNLCDLFYAHVILVERPALSVFMEKYFGKLKRGIVR